MVEIVYRIMRDGKNMKYKFLFISMLLILVLSIGSISAADIGNETNLNSEVSISDSADSVLGTAELNDVSIDTNTSDSSVLGVSEDDVIGAGKFTEVFFWDAVNDTIIIDTPVPPARNTGIDPMPRYENWGYIDYPLPFDILDENGDRIELKSGSSANWGAEYDGLSDVGGEYYNDNLEYITDTYNDQPEYLMLSQFLYLAGIGIEDENDFALYAKEGNHTITIFNKARTFEYTLKLVLLKPKSVKATFDIGDIITANITTNDGPGNFTVYVADKVVANGTVDGNGTASVSFNKTFGKNTYKILLDGATKTGLKYETSLNIPMDSVGGFLDLNRTIANATDVLNLTHDYNLELGQSDIFSSGMIINKNLTINGNGHVINATCSDGTTSRFEILNRDVTLTLNNLTIAGGRHTNGAVFNVAQYSNLILNNVTFIDNRGRYGGAIRLGNYANLTANNVIFKDITATSGAAIFTGRYNTINITNSVFDSNKGTGNGIIIFTDQYTNMEIKNSTFKNVLGKMSNAAGGAIYLQSNSKLVISDSLFENITIAMNGDGNRWRQNNNNGAVIRCEDSTTLNVTGTTFRNNNNINKNSNGNPYGYSYSNGGAIYSAGSNSYSYISESVFINNTAERAGAIYTRNADIIGCLFFNNSATEDYPEIYYEGNGKGTISHNAFLDNNTIIRIMNSASNVVETTNWWGNNNPDKLVRIQNDYQAPNDYVVMSVYNEGKIAYATLEKNVVGDFIENPELIPVRPAVYEASNTTTVNTNNAVASTQINDEQVNITIDGQTMTLFMAPGNITNVQIVKVENTTVGSNGTIYFMLTGDNGDVDGVLSVIVNNHKYDVEVSKGLAIANLGSDFDAGVYDIYYTYAGSANYAAVNNKTKAEEKFEVFKSNVTITLDREKNIVTFNVTGDYGVIPTGTINATVGNITKTFTLNNGVASYNYGNDLGPGVYDVTVSYSGDDNNNEGQLSTTFEIIKYEVTITFTNVTNTLTFNVSGVNGVVPTGKINVTLGDSTQILNLRNGIASYDFGKVLAGGEYNLTASYLGDDYYNPGEMTDTFEVVKMTPIVNVTVNNVNISKGEYFNFVITVIGDENIPTGRIVLTMGDKTYSRNLYNSNTVYVSWGNQHEAGTYNVTVVYEGDGYYYAANSTYENLNVLPKITIDAPSEVYSEKAPLKISINPSDVNGTLIVKMDGVEIFADEIEIGNLYLVLSNLEEGDHTFEVFYGGNDKYLPVTATVTSTVSFPETAQWGQAGYTYTNAGQSPYVRLNEVIELWNYTAETDANYAGFIMIDADGNIYLPYYRNVISLSNDGNERWISQSGWKSFALDHENMAVSQSGNAFNYIRLSDGVAPNPWGGSFYVSSDYSPVIGPDGVLYLNSQFAYGPGGSWSGNCWVGMVRYNGNGYYEYFDHKLPIDGIAYLSQPHISTPSLDNLGNLWHISTTGLRGLVISTNTIGFQSAEIGSKGRPVIDDNNIVYAFGKEDKLYAVTMSGVLWNTTVTDGSGSTLVVGKDSEYVLSVNSEGVLYKYDVTDGKETKIYEFDTTVSSALMTDANGVIYVGDDDGTFWALTDDGTVLWSFDAGSAIAGLPAMDKDGVIYIRTADNVIFALGNHKDNSTISLEVNDTTTVDGLTAIATVNENATGDVVFTLSNGKSYNVEIVNGTATLTVADILAGDYNITAKFNGNYAFKGNETNSSFTVTKVNSTIEIAVPVIYIDANGTINITIENATGNVIVQIEGLNDTSVALNDGIATYVLPILEEGKYNITVTYDGDNKYFNSTATSEFEVVKYTPEINIDVDDVSVIENATLTVNVGNATGNITIKVDEDEETVELENGSATVVLDLLPAGVHNITVTYNGDDLFYEAVNETSFNVSKIDTEIDAVAEAGEAFEDVTITVIVNDIATGNVTVTVDGKDYFGEISDSVAEIIVPNLGAGNYTAVVSYAGDDNVNENSTDVSFTVDKISDYEIESEENLSSIADGTITVTLPEDANGKVTITINNETYTADVVNGTAVVDIPSIIPGDYDYVVAYSDDDNYEDGVSLGSVSIPKEDFELKVTVENDTVIVEVPKSATGYVLVSVDGKGFFAPVENGIATVQTIGLDSGNYTADVIYTGDAVYNPANATASIEIPEEPVVEPEDANMTADVNGTDVGIDLPDDATGYVVVSVDGKDYFFNVTDDIELDLSDLAPGEYPVEITYSGDDKYAPATANTTVTVPEVPVVEPEDANMTADVNDSEVSVELPDDATGYVVVSVDGKDYYFDAADDIELDLSDLAPGEYPVEITYSGDDKYAPATANATVTVPEVLPEDANITVSVENNTITVTADENATGNVLVDVNGTGYYAPLENGKATIDVIGLDEGTYDATVTYSGDDVYAPDTKNATVTVPKKEEPVTPEPVDPEADISVSNETVSMDLPEDATGYMLVDVDGTGYYVPVKDGKASFDLPELAPGNHTIAVTYTGDKNYAPANATQTITVEKEVPTVVAENLTKVEKAPDRFEANFTDASGNPLANANVTFEINGGKYARVTDANGKAGMNINLDAGTYTIVTTNPVTGESVTNTIVVLPRLEGSDLTKYFRNASQYRVKVLDDNGNPAKAGEVVSFNINGVFYNRTTDANGFAQLSINLNPGDYIITAEYKNCRISNNIKVLPVLTGKDLTKKFGEAAAFEATLVDGQGKAYANQRVEFNINGVFYYRNTDSNGVAKLNINLQPGEYIITSVYDAAAISNRVTVTA